MSKVGNFIMEVQEFVDGISSESDSMILRKVFEQYGHFGQDCAREYLKERNGEYDYCPDPV
jgi:hypothetical protein